MTAPPPVSRPSGSLDAPDSPGWRHVRAIFGLVCIIGGPLFFVACAIFKIEDAHTWIIAVLLIAVGVMGLFPLRTVRQALAMVKDFLGGLLGRTPTPPAS